LKRQIGIDHTESNPPRRERSLKERERYKGLSSHLEEKREKDIQ